MRVPLLLIASLTGLSASMADVTAPYSLIVQAENFSAKQGGVLYSTKNQNPAVSVEELGNGHWLRFDSIDFLNGEFDSISIHYWWDWTNAGPSAAVRIRLDSPTATPLVSFASFSGSNSFGYVPANSLKAKLPATTGVHSLYVTVEGSASWLNLDKLVLIGTLTVATGDARTYYVATDGDNANDGLSLAKPFRTIQKAASTMKPGSTCKIRQGVYRETIKPLYSGLPGATLTFEPYNREYVVVSGADPITGWTTGGVAGKSSIYKAPMRWNIGTYSDQVFVDGAMAWVARTPNVDEVYVPHEHDVYNYSIFDASPYQAVTDPISVPTRVGAGNNGFKTDVVDPPAGTLMQRSIGTSWTTTNPLPPALFNQPVDFFKGGLITAHADFLSSGVISGSRYSTFTLNGSTYPKLVIDYLNTSTMKKNISGGAWISHVFGALDAPNEWFRQDSTLYLWTRDGSSPAGRLVEAKRRLLGFDLRGKQYVRVNNIRFLATSLSLEDAVGCIIDRCDFRNVSHYDTLAFWDQGVAYDAPPWNPADGHSGLYISGSDNVLQNSAVIGASGAGVVVAGYHNTVTNCHVTNCNYLGTTQGGITVWRRYKQDPYDGRGITVSRNTLKFNMRANVQVGSGWSPTTSTDPDRLRIHNNDFGASMYVCEEQGSLSAQACYFTEVYQNVFHGTAQYNTGDIVMEVDFGARHWNVHHNVFYQGRDVPRYTDGWFHSSFLRGYSWTFDWGDTGTSAQLPNVGGAMCFNNTVVDPSASAHADWENNWPGFKRNNIMAQGDTAPWKFSNPNGHDYSLTASSSQAIDRGVEIAGWVGSGDYTGAAPDLGAFEFGKPKWTAGADWQPVAWTWYPPAPASATAIPGIQRGAAKTIAVRIVPGAIAVRGLAGRWCIDLFDARGALVKQVRGERQSHATLSTLQLAHGLFVARIRTGGEVASVKLLVPR